MKEIRKNPYLWAWVQVNSDPEIWKIPDFTDNDKGYLAVYSLLNPEATLKCPYGNWLRFKIAKKKLVCRVTCQCWKDDCISKMRDTCEIKYGTRYPSQNPQVRERVESTNRERYGVNRPLQSAEIKKNYSNRLFERKGIYWEAQKHFSDFARKVLFNKDEFLSFFSTHSISEGAILLGVADSTIYDTRAKYCDTPIIISSYEDTLAGWLTQYKIPFTRNTRKIIQPKELDFYLPDFHLAIEMDSLFWHSVGAGKDKFYHWNKTRKCLDKDIQLIHIFEDEWINHRTICLDRLGKILNVGQKTIKSNMREISYTEARPFLERHSMEGCIGDKFKGFFHDGNMVGAVGIEKDKVSSYGVQEGICLQGGVNTSLKDSGLIINKDFRWSKGIGCEEACNPWYFINRFNRYSNKNFNNHQRKIHTIWDCGIENITL